MAAMQEEEEEERKEKEEEMAKDGAKVKPLLCKVVSTLKALFRVPAGDSSLFKLYALGTHAFKLF